MTLALSSSTHTPGPYLIKKRKVKHSLFFHIFEFFICFLFVALNMSDVVFLHNSFRSMCQAEMAETTKVIVVLIIIII